MSMFTETARKNAGIAKMTAGNYPADTKHRGARYWGLFVTSADTLYEELRKERDALQKKVTDEAIASKKLIEENKRLGEALSKANITVVSEELRREVPEFTPGHQSRLLEQIGKN